MQYIPGVTANAAAATRHHCLRKGLCKPGNDSRETQNAFLVFARYVQMGCEVQTAAVPLCPTILNFKQSRLELCNHQLQMCRSQELGNMLYFEVTALK